MRRVAPENPDAVESDRTRVGMQAELLRRQGPQGPLLGWGHGLERGTEFQAGSSFYLHEHQGASVERNKIQLAPAQTQVLSDNLVAESAQMAVGELLAGPGQLGLG